MDADRDITNEDIYADMLALKAGLKSFRDVLGQVSGSLDRIEGHLYQTEVNVIGINNTLDRMNVRFDGIERRLERIQKGSSHGNRT